MPRPARFTSEQILDATLRRIAAEGPAAATISTIAADVGAPTGSLYHRFSSRDVLIATLWLDVVERFQTGFLAALDHDDPVEGGRLALEFGLDWCRAHPLEARLLLLHRREDLLAYGFPKELQERASLLAARAERALRSYAKRRCGRASATNMRLVRFALIDAPFAALREDVEGGRVPSRVVDELTLRVYGAVFEQD